jgi:hypothetical protein
MLVFNTSTLRGMRHSLRAVKFEIAYRWPKQGNAQ